MHFVSQGYACFILASKEKMTIDSGDKLSFTSGQDWQALSANGKFNITTEEEQRLEGQKIASNAGDHQLKTPSSRPPRPTYMQEKA